MKNLEGELNILKVKNRLGQLIWTPRTIVWTLRMKFIIHKQSYWICKVNGLLIQMNLSMKLLLSDQI